MAGSSSSSFSGAERYSSRTCRSYSRLLDFWIRMYSIFVSERREENKNRVYVQFPSIKLNHSLAPHAMLPPHVDLTGAYYMQDTEQGCYHDYRTCSSFPSCKSALDGFRSIDSYLSPY